ncbi:hypothetical protein E2C01_069646 [Portunus trituberculatus]|uniref:Uncharacterized protein n=1 Tax=Portunus trituberculatus TaxID=210409 RepID=A0A5B7HQL2_PORTR|nr:hypothetical protein [Portunus trituberculatus]
MWVAFVACGAGDLTVRREKSALRKRARWGPGRRLPCRRSSRTSTPNQSQRVTGAGAGTSRRPACRHKGV